jgi:1,4-dihydroxy-2-naphthoyl-CoA hydrolase
VEVTPEDLGTFGRGTFFELLGVELLAAEAGAVRARLGLRPDHLAPNGYLHAGTVVGFADSMCGTGTMVSLPEGALGFTTIELKTNFLRTALSGSIEGESALVHGGRTTQIWDARIRDDRGRPVALFRCTQLLLYPPR